MADHEIFEIGEISSVGYGEHEEVRFVRNQAVDKMFPGAMRRRLARAKKRAEKRGEIFDPTKISRSKVVDRFHSSFLESQSTGQPFMIHISWKEAYCMAMEKKKKEDSVRTDWQPVVCTVAQFLLGI